LFLRDSRQEKLDFFSQSGADLPFLFPMAIGDVTADKLLGSSSATAPPKHRLVEMLVVRHGPRGAPTDRDREA
jgi:hypothetical protein